jgi:hypothetical protein
VRSRPEFWRENNNRHKLSRVLMEFIVQKHDDEKRLAMPQVRNGDLYRFRQHKTVT